MSRKFTILFLLFAIGVGVYFFVSPREYYSNDLQPYSPDLGSELRSDLQAAIDFALASDPDLQVSESDFDSCIVLIDIDVHENITSTYYKHPAYVGTLSGLFNLVLEEYAGLLCTAHRDYSPDNLKSILIWRGEEPFVVTRSQVLDIEDALLSSLENIDAVSPRDLGYVGQLTLSFKLSSEGQIILDDGSGVSVYIRYPEVYLNYTNYLAMWVDIPEIQN